MLGCWVELPGGDEHPPGDANGFDLIFTFSCSRRILNGEKLCSNALGMVRHLIILKPM